MAARCEITQVRSTIGTKPKQRGTLRALGLRRIDHTVEHPDRPEIRGHGRRACRTSCTVEEVIREMSDMKIHDLKPAAGLEDDRAVASAAASAARAARPPAGA